jgi:hypothetical protein
VQIFSKSGRDYLGNSSLAHAKTLLVILEYHLTPMADVETRRVDGVPWMVQIDDCAIMHTEAADGCRHDLCVNGGPLAVQDDVCEPMKCN